MDHSNRAIVIVEDDEDDIEIITSAYSALNESNELIVLRSGKELELHLDTNEAPFFILCDFHLPGENALTIRKRVLEQQELRYKSVPFILWSTSADERQIKESFDSLIQGFFVKPPSYNEIKSTLSAIIDYWKRSEHPKPNLK